MFGGFVKGYSLAETMNLLHEPEIVRERERLLAAHQKERDRTLQAVLFEEYSKLNVILEKNVVRLLRTGKIHAAGFTLPISINSHSELISADLWEIGEVDFTTSELSVRNLRIVNIEVYGSFLGRSKIRVDPRPDMQPSRVDEPKQVAAIDEVEFQHDEEYSRVIVRKLVFIITGAMQASVVRQLHEASKSPTKWVHGKILLRRAESGSRSVGDLFKTHTNPSWRELIESNARGKYRLNLFSNKPAQV